MSSTTIRKAIGYVRKSTEEQRLESLEAQERAIRAYAKSIGILDVKIFADSGISAKTDKRPAFQEAISTAIDNKVEAFIVHKFDRFSRNKYDSAIYKQKLEKANVKIISVIERSMGTPEDIIMESFYEGMAEYYSANLAREVMKGLKENAYKAQFNGGSPPLGYDVDRNKHYIVNDAEASIVRHLFKMISEGMTYGEVIHEFQRLGYRTKNKACFGKNSIYAILKNERYKGVYTFNKARKRNRDGSRNSHSVKDKSEIIRVEDAIPAIVDTETFDRVQELMQLRKKDGAANKATEVYLLQGVIYCGECGAAMHGNRRKNGSGNYYISYRCGDKSHKLTCKNKEIQRDNIEEFIIRILEKNLFNPSNVKRLVKTVNDKIESQFNNRTETDTRIEKELKEVVQKLDNILKAIESGNTHEVLFDRLNEIQKQKDMLECEKAEHVRTGNLKRVSEEEIRLAFKEYRKTLKTNNRQLIKSLIKRFIKKISVYENRIELEFNPVLLLPNLSMCILDDFSWRRHGSLLAC